MNISRTYVTSSTCLNQYEQQQATSKDNDSSSQSTFLLLQEDDNQHQIVQINFSKKRKKSQYMSQFCKHQSINFLKQLKQKKNPHVQQEKNFLNQKNSYIQTLQKHSLQFYSIKNSQFYKFSQKKQEKRAISKKVNCFFIKKKKELLNFKRIYEIIDIKQIKPKSKSKHLTQRKEIYNRFNNKKLILGTIQQGQYFNGSNINKNTVKVQSKQIILNGQSKQSQLNLSYTKIDDQYLSYVIQCLPFLKYLNLEYCLNLKNIKIKNYKTISQINLSSCSVQNLHLQQLMNLNKLSIFPCQKLRQVVIVNCDLFNENQLKLMPKTKLLYISYQSNVQKLQSLKLTHKLNQFQQENYINLYLNDLLINKTNNIKKLKMQNLQLKKFDFILDQSTSSDLYQNQESFETKKSKETKQLNIEQLSIKNCHLLTQVILQNCIKLKKLKITGQCDMLLKLQLNLAVNLTQLDLSSVKNLKRVFLKNCYNLKSLNLRTLFLEQFELTSTLQQNVLKLEKLNLFNFKQINLIDFNQINKLKRINMTSTLLKQGQIQNILSLNSNLEEINLTLCQSLKHILFDHSKLQIIILRQSSIHSIQLKYLPQLYYLDISQCQNLNQIIISQEKQKFNKLQQLNLEGSCQVSESQIQKLKQKLPKTKVIVCQNQKVSKINEKQIIKKSKLLQKIPKE